MSDESIRPSWMAERVATQRRAAGPAVSPLPGADCPATMAPSWRRHAHRHRERTRLNEHHPGLPGRRATPPPTCASWRAHPRRQGQAAVDRGRRQLLVRDERWRRQAVRAGRPGGGHPRAGLRPRTARRRARRRLRATRRPRGPAFHGHRAGRGRRGVRRVRRALALPLGQLRLRAGRIHAAGQPAGGAVTRQEGRGVPAGARPVGALAVRRPRVGADHRRRARLPVRLRPGLHKQRHPATQVRSAAPAARGGLVARFDEGAGPSDR